MRGLRFSMHVRNISKYRKIGRRKKNCRNSCDLWAPHMNVRELLPAAKQANFPDLQSEPVVSLPIIKTLVETTVCLHFQKFGHPAARNPKPAGRHLPNGPSMPTTHRNHHKTTAQLCLSALSISFPDREVAKGGNQHSNFQKSEHSPQCPSS